MNNDTTNPFDSTTHQFYVLKNSRGTYSLWPEFREIPTGSQPELGPEERQACIDYIEQHWTLA